MFGENSILPAVITIFLKMEKENKSWLGPGLVLFYRLSGWIGGPVILALFVGRWLDRRYGTEPWLFLACIGTAFIGSSVGIVVEGVKAIKEMEKKDN